MNNTKRNIYVIKAALPPVVTNLALWAKDGKAPDAIVIVIAAILAECAWQAVNALGAYYSNPSEKPNGVSPATPPQPATPEQPKV